MPKYLYLMVCLWLLPSGVLSQVFPKDGATVNYRIVGFIGSSLRGATDYKLEIARGNYNSDAEFNAHVVVSLSGKSERIIAEVPSFGEKYTWRLSASGGKPAVVTKGILCHFNTGFVPEVDSNLIRLRILSHATAFKDAYVFLDNTKVLYDMKGKPVWYLPKLSWLADVAVLRDLKLSCAGTITFLGNDMPYEIDYSGNLLWKAPNNGKVSGDTSEYYHHEFTRLTNGHYMVLGNEPGDACGTVIEYDKAGNVLWYWKGYDYFKTSGVLDYLATNNINPDVHGNSFYFDEKNKIIYLSYRNISRIVKIKYPDGVVVSSYGEQYRPGVPMQGNGLFCNQHACKRSQIGCLFLFNNNGCNPGYNPKVKILKEPANDSGGLKKIWEYECNIADGYAKVCPSGGNVMELKDHSLFVSMGGAYGRVFIVTMDKKELWSAVAEAWLQEQNKWVPMSHYRASIIEDGNQLSKLIWYHEFDKPELLSE